MDFAPIRRGFDPLVVLIPSVFLIFVPGSSPQGIIRFIYLPPSNTSPVVPSIYHAFIQQPFIPVTGAAPCFRC